MPNDQFGRPISVGDKVTIKGEVTKVIEDQNFVNCTVKLAQQMPPAGTETNLQLNTAQVEKAGGGSKGGESKGAQQPQAPQTQAQQPQAQHPPAQQPQAQQPAPHSGSKK